MKILITNIIVQNGGDAAIMLGMIKAIKNEYKNNCDIKAFVESTKFCKKYYPDIDCGTTLGRQAMRSKISNWRFLGRRYIILKSFLYIFYAYLIKAGYPISLLLIDKKAKEAFRDYRTADIICSCGGTYLLEEYGIKSQYIDYKIALIFRKPLFFYTQSIGKFNGSQNRQYMIEIFDKCKGIILRDRQSLDNVCDLKVDYRSKCEIMPDAAFSLLDNSYTPAVVDGKKKLNIAISVRYWAHSKDKNTSVQYRKTIAKAIQTLLKEGHYISIFSTCQGNDGYTDDNKEADLILEMLSKAERAEIKRSYECLTPNDVMNNFKNTDLLIATRLHMAILGSISGIAILPIAYEFKTNQLFLNSFEYEKVWSLEDLEPVNFCEYMLNFINNISEYQQKISKNNHKLAAMSMNVANIMNEKCKGIEILK